VTHKRHHYFVFFFFKPDASGVVCFSCPDGENTFAEESFLVILRHDLHTGS
jgi:hypothetical protein